MGPILLIQLIETHCSPQTNHLNYLIEETYLISKKKMNNRTTHILNELIYF